MIFIKNTDARLSLGSLKKGIEGQPEIKAQPAKPAVKANKKAGIKAKKAVPAILGPASWEKSRS